MSIDIYEFHTDPSKLKGYGTEEHKIYRDLIQVINRGGDALEYNDHAQYIFAAFIKKYENNKSKILKMISGDAKMSYIYALTTLHGPFPQGEDSISKAPSFAFKYALNIIKGRFKLGEPAIAADATYAYRYAKEVIKNRFELGEPAILHQKNYVNRYTEYVLIPNGIHVDGFN